ncbi:MAG: shikimate dehydrogenase [Candidatus Omnitrophica bacterium CG11_big_fil_rev_8_21_14_0_20_45_26]|uniref:Shikimate dehydrogenase (NADP(+)) n=1 Tax=Candidatus Abzuiibacterium crystallinum TaxID=1974748 RepID=A0A2H0LMG8_9BACT|nr:MAG: shikimate dehydrogenase [Candidatus Omnitrophica bacterium CG11_big_fil_rev_8_21_14_0_20_45_26]PIW65161.1 MAG: shikimate dehydrogenase [Candidatus Omnitrophica bacterium CG12_big_fil_rev_8_21_14_0_65_45_16]
MLNEEVKVFGLFGYPLSHSLSPAMQNAALRTAGIPGVYLAFERDRRHFLRLLRNRRKLILDGFNLTVPHKETILPFLDRIDQVAKDVGAVNTVKRAGKHWIGFNTDVDGFLRALQEAGLRLKGKKTLLLGAGGAAKAAAYALVWKGVRELRIFNRTQNRGRQLCRVIQKKFPHSKVMHVRNKSELKQALFETDLLVNATSAGLRHQSQPLIPRSLWPKGKRVFVFDMMYGRRPTELIRTAKRLRHRTLDGETMLLHQGARAFEIWTGRKAPLAVMRKALRHAIMGS